MLHKLSLAALVSLFVCSLALAAIPPSAEKAKEAIEKTPRHAEYVDIEVPGSEVKLKSYVVYPERKEKAPVVIVIHEIFGLSDWVKGVADQFAADGFIAIAPDFLSGKGPDGGGSDSFKSADELRRVNSGLNTTDVMKQIDAARAYGIKLPAANGKSATVGFCWGGARSFEYAAHQPELNAAAVYYGTSPNAEKLQTVKAPVIGLYGGNDQRVNATIKPAEDKMKELGKTYQPHIFDGAGHGFLRQQSGQGGANLKASEQAWDLTVKFFREHTK